MVEHASSFKKPPPPLLSSQSIRNPPTLHKDSNASLHRYRDFSPVMIRVSPPVFVLLLFVVSTEGVYWLFKTAVFIYYFICTLNFFFLLLHSQCCWIVFSVRTATCKCQSVIFVNGCNGHISSKVESVLV